MGTGQLRRKKHTHRQRGRDAIPHPLPLSFFPAVSLPGGHHLCAGFFVFSVNLLLLTKFGNLTFCSNIGLLYIKLILSSRWFQRYLRNFDWLLRLPAIRVFVFVIKKAWLFFCCMGTGIEYYIRLRLEMNQSSRPYAVWSYTPQCMWHHAPSMLAWGF